MGGTRRRGKDPPVASSFFRYKSEAAAPTIPYSREFCERNGICIETNVLVRVAALSTQSAHEADGCRAYGLAVHRKPHFGVVKRWYVTLTYVNPQG